MLIYFACALQPRHSWLPRCSNLVFLCAFRSCSREPYLIRNGDSAEYWSSPPCVGSAGFHIACITGNSYFSVMAEL